jgi:hypothetical protein
MSSASQKAANRNNAKLSTGPQTGAGKARSSQNALRHGLASNCILVGDEVPEDFDALVGDLVAEHQPATATEELLVKQMAQNFWLIQRAMRLQCQRLNESDNRDRKLVPPELALLIRYQTANERAFHKALATLTKLQQERTKAADRFVSQKPQSDSPKLRKTVIPDRAEVPSSPATVPAAPLSSDPDPLSLLMRAETAHNDSDLWSTAP